MDFPSFIRSRSTAWIAFLALFHFAIHSTASNSSCYYPDGLENNGVPCTVSDAVSTCCGPGFVCLGNGLCKPGPKDTKSYDYKFYRSGCTDPTWDSPTCPRICIGARDHIDSGQGLLTCAGDPNRYCCAHGGDCCSNSTNIFTLGLASIVTTIPYISSSATSTLAQTSSVNASSGSSGLSKGASIGVGVGVGVGGTLALLIAGFLLLQRRRMKSASRQASKGDNMAWEMGDTRGNAASAAVVKDAEHFTMPEEDEGRAHLPSSPLELEHSPRFELGVLPDTSQESRDIDYPGRYFKEEGVHRHEVPG